MEAIPPNPATAGNKPRRVAEACDDCGSALSYNQMRNESVCDSCGLVSDTATHVGNLGQGTYEANYRDQRAVRKTNVGGTSTTWDLDGTDAFGSRIQPDVLRRMRRLNTVQRNGYRINPKQRRAQAFNDHLKHRLMALEQDWTGEMKMMYRETESMYLAVCGHMELRQLRHTNTLRSRYPPEMKWDILAMILRHEWRRNQAPLAQKISRNPHRYIAKKSSPDVARFVQQYSRLDLPITGLNVNHEHRVSQTRVVSYVVKVLKAINQVFSPQNEAEFAYRFARQSTPEINERCEALVLMVETVANAHGVTVSRNDILKVHQHLLRHDKYPLILAPNHLRSCHVEVTYWLLRACSPEGPTLPRTKVKKAIASEPTIAGTVSKAPQKAWGSMAQACVNEVMQHV